MTLWISATCDHESPQFWDPNLMFYNGIVKWHAFSQWNHRNVNVTFHIWDDLGVPHHTRPICHLKATILISTAYIPSHGYMGVVKWCNIVTSKLCMYVAESFYLGVSFHLNIPHINNIKKQLNIYLNYFHRWLNCH